ncbi:hypothetical protein H0H93_001190, partial [Arthromyces matolae]
RLVTGFAPGAFEGTELKAKFIEALFVASEWSSSWSQPIPKPRETNILLLFRTLANVFQEKISLSGTWSGKTLEYLSQTPYSALNKAQRVALATILFNASCVALRTPVEKVFFQQLISLILQILNSENVDSEAAYRALVGLGNLLYAAKAQSLLNIGNSGDIVR